MSFITDGTDRIMVGTVIMLPDEVNGGVTSRTYLNVTLRKYVRSFYFRLSIDLNEGWWGGVSHRLKMTLGLV